MSPRAPISSVSLGATTALAPLPLALVAAVVSGASAMSLSANGAGGFAHSSVSTVVEHTQQHCKC
jgi:hypothetical protein